MICDSFKQDDKSKLQIIGTFVKDRNVKVSKRTVVRMVYFLTLILFLLIILFLSRPITVILHELGHAIPAIIFTKEPVSIYIGSHGDPSKSLHFEIGFLEVWFKYNPFLWKFGLCVPGSKNISITQQIVYIITGPLTSTAIAVIVCYATFFFDISGIYKLLLVIFLGSSLYDLVTSLIPNETPILLFDGTQTYNDGYQLRQLIKTIRYKTQYEEGVALYNEKEYSESANIFNSILSGGLKTDTIYRLAIFSFLSVNKFSEAKKLSDELIVPDNINALDFTNAGLSYSHVGLHEKALELYDKALQLDPNEKYAQNNKGYTLILLNKFEEAIKLLDKSIELDNQFAHFYDNRGLAKIKIGKTEEGLQDIKYSMQLDETNPYSYRNLGIYHLEMGESDKALKLLNKAKELDQYTHLIDDLILKAEGTES